MNNLKKYSRKREAMLQKIQATKSHPSADWVYGELRKEIPDLSLGTVYRNLAMFKDEGLIISVGVVNGQERFDGNTSEHTHFICETCGDVIDVDEALDDGLNAGIENRYGVKVDFHRLTFYGKCGKCKE